MKRQGQNINTAVISRSYVILDVFDASAPIQNNNPWLQYKWSSNYGLFTFLSSGCSQRWISGHNEQIQVQHLFSIQIGKQLWVGWEYMQMNLVRDETSGGEKPGKNRKLRYQEEEQMLSNPLHEQEWWWSWSCYEKWKCIWNCWGSSGRNYKWKSPCKWMHATSLTKVEPDSTWICHFQLSSLQVNYLNSVKWARGLSSFHKFWFLSFSKQSLKWLMQHHTSLETDIKRLFRFISVGLWFLTLYSVCYIRLSKQLMETAGFMNSIPGHCAWNSSEFLCQPLESFGKESCLQYGTYIIVDALCLLDRTIISISMQWANFRQR